MKLKKVKILTDTARALACAFQPSLRTFHLDPAHVKGKCRTGLWGQASSPSQRSLVGGDLRTTFINGHGGGRMRPAEGVVGVWAFEIHLQCGTAAI